MKVSNRIALPYPAGKWRYLVGERRKRRKRRGTGRGGERDYKHLWFAAAFHRAIRCLVLAEGAIPRLGYEITEIWSIINTRYTYNRIGKNMGNEGGCSSVPCLSWLEADLSRALLNMHHAHYLFIYFYLFFSFFFNIIINLSVGYHPGLQILESFCTLFLVCYYYYYDYY